MSNINIFFLKLIRYTGDVIRNIYWMFITAAPLSLYLAYLKTIFRRSIRRTYADTISEFQKKLLDKKFSNDWFTHNIPYWKYAFELSNINPKNILEIGCWEGMSSLFLMTQYPDASLSAVDTWLGADEHQGSDNLNKIESNFDFNLGDYFSKINKFKGRSIDFFCKNNVNYDLIYIDGSHYCNDVIVDAIKSYELLEVGGIIIFDDYFWRHYSDPKSNPAAAVNCFMKLKKYSYRIISIDWQIILQKTSHTQSRDG